MFKQNSKKLSAPGQSIIRWFLICFVCFSLIFLIVLIPLISYCRNVFTELEINKSTQQMNFGISQLENTVASISSASQSLTNDTRFIPFHYLEPDYSSITVSVQKQMKDYLNGLFFPLTLVSDCALQFSADMVITPDTVISGNKPGYYPYRFCVDDLTYEEWTVLLQENKSGFLAAHTITTSNKTYNALIYSIPWTKGSYLYACMDISALKQALITKSDLDSYYLTISNTAGSCLYTDLSGTHSDYYSVTQKTSVGNLVVTIHIPKSALTARMSPLYCFLGLYIGLCVLVMLVTVVLGSHFSSKPLLKIIHIMEAHNTQLPAPDEQQQKKRIPSLHYGFHYIQDRVNLYVHDINEYRNTIYTQTKVLQSRFMEKALNGALVNAKDKELFLSYFPNFPKSYCLVQLGLLNEQSAEDSTPYPNALHLIQSFIQCELPNTYQQQMNDSELLLVIAEEDFEQYSCVLNHLIANINREEPSYFAWGIASEFYQHIESMPIAYWHLQDANGSISSSCPSQLCMASDYQDISKPKFQMADILTMYTAITYGNKELALQNMQKYSGSLHANSRSVFEMIRSVLLCITQEYPAQLFDVDIPLYHSECDMYTLTENTINKFCDAIHEKNQTGMDSFAQKLKDYIDVHFKEYDLCLTVLEEQFKCSTSKIQKSFKKAMGITVTDYIEKNRMNLANTLLYSTKKNIAEIAQECGFANANSFNKAYKRIYGCSPTSVKHKL